MSGRFPACSGTRHQTRQVDARRTGRTTECALSQTQCMPALTAFGHVTLRPVRVALVDEFASPEALRLASQLATAHWGGLDYLFLPAPLTQRALDLARALVDVGAPLQGSGKALDLPGDLEYRAWPSENPFDRGDGSLNSHVLGMESLNDLAGAAASWGLNRLVWDQDHPLAQVLAVLHGDLPKVKGEYAPDEHSRHNLGDSDAIPADVFTSGLLSRTRRGLLPRKSAAYRGVVCVDPTSIHDLVGFWNLRASGAQVALYPLGHELLADAYLDAWRGPLAGDAGPVMLYATTAEIATRAAEALRPRFGIDFHMQRLAAVPDWVYVLPVESHYTQRFDVTLEDDAWQARLPLPRLDFLPAAAWYERYGTVAADIRISTSRQLRRQRRFAVPLRREQAADLLKTRTSPAVTPFLLADGDGFTMGVDAREDSISAPAVATLEVLQTLFGVIGAKVSRSDAGLYVERLIDMLGGVAPDGVALQPAVRAVLHRAATAPYGKPVPALVSEARKRAGAWPDSFFGRGRDYAAWAVQWLCDKDLLQARLKSKCPSCGNTLSITPSDLSNSVTCPLCATVRPLALHLTALRPEWRLALHGDVRHERVFETLPVMAALSLIAGARGYSGEELHSAAGVRVTHPDVDCEVDLVVASQERQHPLVIIGECKSYRDSVTPADVGNLTEVQSLLLDQGVECYTLFATMREHFDADEVELLRSASTRVPSTRQFRPREAIEPIAPLVLDGHSMSTHSFSDESLLRAGQGPRSLARLAVASCTRSLGLVSYAYKGEEQQDLFVASWAPAAESNAQPPTQPHPG